jgi:hypothetical protein
VKGDVLDLVISAALVSGTTHSLSGRIQHMWGVGGVSFSTEDLRLVFESVLRSR